MAVDIQVVKEQKMGLQDIVLRLKQQVDDWLRALERPDSLLVAEHLRCTVGKQDFVWDNKVVVAGLDKRELQLPEDIDLQAGN